MKDQKGYRGYVFSRPIEDYRVPQHIQNLVIRAHATKHNLVYILSGVEHRMTESYLMLNQMLEDLDSIDGIIFFSLFMLPKSFHHRELILNSILDSGKQIHFATEDMIINNFDQVSSLNNIFLVREVAAKGNFKENLQTALLLTQNR